VNRVATQEITPEPTVKASGDRPAVVLGLLWAGLSFARSLGRIGVPVTGISMHPHEFGVRSRYLRQVRRVHGEEAALAALRQAAAGERPVLLPERDDHVELVLRNWDEISPLFELPMPPDPDVARRLRHKETLPEEAARAGVAAPATVAADSEETLRSLDLRPPFLLKPVEGQHFAGSFGLKVIEAGTVDQLVAAWREARARGFDTVVQELIPDARAKIWSLFAYIGRSGRPLATATGVKVRQGPIDFGTSAVFRTRPEPRVRELGLRLLESAGYRGFGHVEFAHDHRDGEYKLLEVNTRVPMWAGVAMSPYLDMARIAYEDLCGRPEPEPRDFEDEVSWSFLAKDLYVSLAMARRRELSLRAFLGPYLRRQKVRAVLAKDDPLPALGVLRYLGSKLS
jgi:D-aspartate ligase